MSKIQFCLDTCTFYIEFNIDKFTNISKRYVSFLKNMTKMRISWCWKVGCLTKIIYQAENKTNNQNYCLQTIVQCGAEIARLTSQIFMHKKFGLKSINQPEVTNNWRFCSPIIVHLLSFHFKHDILTLTRF